MSFNKFKSDFIQYYATIENTKSILPQLKSTLTKAVTEELPLRDKQKLFIERDFRNSGNLKINLDTKNTVCRYSTKDKRLYVGVIVPKWKTGWNKISEDGFICELMGDFFYLVNRYIYRSFQINLIGALALAFNTCCHFSGQSSRETTIFNDEFPTSDTFKNIPPQKIKSDKLLMYYLSIINSLDPDVNRTVFYYIRSLTHWKNGYIEEAVLSADTMIDTIRQSKIIPFHQGSSNKMTRNQEIGHKIGLSKEAILQLADLYNLRCDFSAHPSKNSWWDFEEIYDSYVAKILETVKTVLIKFCLYENNNRRIEKSPVQWSQWFLNHCDVLFNAVWIHKLREFR